MVVKNGGAGAGATEAHSHHTLPGKQGTEPARGKLHLGCAASKAG